MCLRSNVHEYLILGNSSGEIHIVSVAESALKVKNKLHEHKVAIVDIASSYKSDVLASCDVNGVIITYDGNVGITNRISTG